MGNQHNSLPLESRLNALFKDMLAHLGVHRRERVVKQVELTVGIHSTGQADPLPLSSREVDTPLPNLWTGIIASKSYHPMAFVGQELPKAPWDPGRQHSWLSPCTQAPPPLTSP